MNGEKESHYQVKAIIGQRINEGILQYKIRWEGYDQNDDTWEDFSSLDCKEMNDEYNKKFSKEQKTRHETPETRETPDTD